MYDCCFEDNGPCGSCERCEESEEWRDRQRDIAKEIEANPFYDQPMPGEDEEDAPTGCQIVISSVAIDELKEKIRENNDKIAGLNAMNDSLNEQVNEISLMRNIAFKQLLMSMTDAEFAEVVAARRMRAGVKAIHMAEELADFNDQLRRDLEREES